MSSDCVFMLFLFSLRGWSLIVKKRKEFLVNHKQVVSWKQFVVVIKSFNKWKINGLNKWKS